MGKAGGLLLTAFASDAGEMIGSIAARTEDGGFNLGFLLARSHLGARLHGGSHHRSCRLGFYSALGFPRVGSV